MQKEELAGEVNALEARKAEIQGAVRAMSAAGMAEITAAKVAAVAQIKLMIEELMTEMGRAAEVKVEAAKLEDELYYARFLKADDTTLQKAPKDLAEVYLKTLVRFCRVRAGFQKIKPPDDIFRKNYPFRVLGEVALVDLLEWGLAGLNDVVIRDRQRVPRYLPIGQTAGPASTT